MEYDYSHGGWNTIKNVRWGHGNGQLSGFWNLLAGLNV